MNRTELFRKSFPFLAALAVFFALSGWYFRPAFNGYAVNQPDIVNFKGMSNDIIAFRDANDGLEPLWTNSMFGGMPATQITVQDQGNFVTPIRNVLSLGLPQPVDILFLYFIGFFILALCLRINPWIGIVGAIAFGFSTYYIIIIEAGHNSKAYAIAFMAPVVGTFLMAYRGQLKWGILLSAFFMMLQIGQNHVQITYYLGFLLIGLGTLQFALALKNRELKQFGMATLGLLVAYGLAAMTSAANLIPTNEYAKETIRGKNNLTISPDLNPATANQTSGLDKDYITQWSYGKSESLTLINPYAKGGHTTLIGNGEFKDKLQESDFTRSEKEFIGNSLQYWGDQPFTSGPVYLGGLVMALAILGLFFIASPVKWVLFAVALLSLFLSWGKNMMWLTDLFLEHVPLYSKFRAVTIILAIVELCIPILMILFLHQLWTHREQMIAQRKKFLYISGGIVAIMALLIANPGMTGLHSEAEMEKLNDPYTAISAEVAQQVSRIPAEQLVQYGVQNPSDKEEVARFVDAVTQQQVEAFENNQPALTAFRADIFSQHGIRSLTFIVLGLGLIALFLFMPSTSPYLVVAGIGLLVTIDLVGINLLYLNTEGQERSGEMIYDKWVKNEEKQFPLYPKDTDQQILEAEMAADPALAQQVNQAAQRAEKYAKEQDFSRIARMNYVERERFRVYNERTHFRVADFTDAMFSSSRASYFHESVGGYHGAKLQRYQNLIEFDFIPYDRQILNMLNTKYLVQNTNQGPMLRTNPEALGHAWFTRNVIVAVDENEEILKLGKEYALKAASDSWKLLVNEEQITEQNVYGREKVVLVKGTDTLQVQWPDGMPVSAEAVLVKDINGRVNWIMNSALELDTANSFEVMLNLKVAYNFVPSAISVVPNEHNDYVGNSSFTGEGSIELKAQQLNYLKYESDSPAEQLAVFSEIYYPAGWTAKIDGKEVEHIRVNYILRGLKVPAGKHTIEFEVNRTSYENGHMFAKISSWIILILLLTGISHEIWVLLKKGNQRE
jgi:hypothetical protein